MAMMTAILALPALLAVMPAHAQQDPAQLQPQQIERELRRLLPGVRAAGQGTLRLFGFHIYDARLYTGSRGLRSEALTETPFALDLRYARDFKGADIARRSRLEMEKLDAATPAERRDWEDLLTRLLPDVRAGDHLTGVFRPGQGTVFLHNAQPLGEVPGEAFARAFFAIWLDARTSAPAVRSALLAGTAPR